MTRANAKPPFVLRSQRASWTVLFLALAYPVWVIVLMITDPQIVKLWPYMLGLFVLLLACPIYSILWFRRRRGDGDDARA